MKKRMLSIATMLVMALLLLTSGMPDALAAGSKVSIQVNATLLTTEAKSMLSMINAFRTGKDAWYYAQNNKTKVKVTGLKKLTYDKGLERIAMQRAIELAVYFSHTRPDGSAWSSLYPQGNYARGENVAYGFGTAASVFAAFKEDNKPYVGQGHRRNMLRKEFTRVGFGAVRVGRVVYWVQEFASGKAITAKSPSKVVTANMRVLGTNGVRASSSEVVIQKGKSVALPAVSIISGSGAHNTLLNQKWTSSKTSCVTVKNGKLVGNAVGSSKLTATVSGVKLSMKASVITTTPTKTEEIDEYETPLGLEEGVLIMLEGEDECFENPTSEDVKE